MQTIIIEIFYIIFPTNSLKSGICFNFKLRLDTFEILSSHMWQVAVILDCIVIESGCRHLDLRIRGKNGKNWPIGAQLKSFFLEAFSSPSSGNNIFLHKAFMKILFNFFCVTFNMLSFIAIVDVYVLTSLCQFLGRCFSSPQGQTSEVTISTE